MSRGTLDRRYRLLTSLTGLLPPSAVLSSTLQLARILCRGSATPDDRSLPVWALTVSLAATQVIVFTFSSSGYLDVSVHRVPSTLPMDSVMGT